MADTDPFATAAPPDEADPFAEVEAGAPDMPEPEGAEPPIVDREGREVTASQAGQRMAAEAAAKAAAEPAADAQPAEAEPAAEVAPVPAGPQEAADGGGEPPQAPQAAPPAPQEPEGGSGAQAPADNGVELRRYKLLYATGPGQWAEAPLDADGPHAERDEKGELWLKARNADHARRLAWVVFDRPEEGVQCVPVAASSWKPRIVKKAAPQPERERLEIV